MIIHTNALVIKEQAVGESDRLITLLTENHGVIKAFARRAKNLKDSKNASTSLLAYSKFSIYQGKDKYIIDSASTIELFFSLRENLVNLSLAQYFCELSFLLVPEGTDNPEFLKVILNSIAYLCNQKRNPLLLKAITELRLLSLSGFMPDLVACDICKCYESDLWQFFLTTGQIVCRKCCQNPYNSIEINSTVLLAMRHTIYVEMKKLYSFNIPKNETLKMCLVCEKYTLNTLGHYPMTLDFFKTINEEKYE